MQAKTPVAAAVALMLGLGAAGAEKSTIERLTGAPEKSVVPHGAPEAYDKLPPGWRTNIVIIGAEPGGSVADHLARFTDINSRERVEVRGPCKSACTLVMHFVPRERLCFSNGGSLHFHWASTFGRPDFDATQRMVNKYPAHIQAWIYGKGGIDKMPRGNEPLWELTAEELWKMGYNKCTP